MRGARRLPRCMTCGLHEALCLCATLPWVELRDAIVIVQHHGERSKPTNTGRLTHRMLAGSSLLVYGARDERFDPAPLLDLSRDAFVLFPSPDARAPEEGWFRGNVGRPRTFVLLDGTWSQAGRMARRIPEIARLPRLALPPGRTARWGIRKAPRPDKLCTVEAAIRLVELAEGAEKAGPLEGAFMRVVDRLMAMKGRPWSGNPKR